MQLVYGLDMNTFEHHLLCDGIGARFNISGKYISSQARVLSNSLPVDCLSILQQGNLCEVGILVCDNFVKRIMDFSRVQNWLKTLPLANKAVFQLKRQVGTERCVQTIYIYPYNRLSAFIGQLM